MQEELEKLRVLRVLKHGEQVVINKGYDDGLKEGQSILIYELGEEIIDRNTGISYGQLEVVKGTGRIVHLQSNMSTVESVRRTKPEKRIIRNRSGSLFSAFGSENAEEEIYDGGGEVVPFDDAREGDFAKIVKG